MKGLHLELEDDDHSKIKTDAAKAGLSIKDFILARLKFQTLKARLSEEEILMLRQLIGMANNLNQIARRLHEGGEQFEQAYNDALQGVEDIKQIITKLSKP